MLKRAVPTNRLLRIWGRWHEDALAKAALTKSKLWRSTLRERGPLYEALAPKHTVPTIRLWCRRLRPMQKRPPLWPVPNELANYHSNANKLTQRVEAMPGLNKSGGNGI